MAAGGLAILAGRGELPRMIAEAEASAGRPYRVIELAGVPLPWAGAHPVIKAEFEKPGRLFKALRADGCDRIVLAGGIVRPSLNPLRFDRTMLRHAPKVLAGLKAGDDRTLRVVAELFEAEGLRLVAAQDVLGDLVAERGVLGRVAPSEADRADAARAAEIVAALGRADVGQGAVVAQGLCLGVETIQGTDAMLSFVAETAAGARPDSEGARGVFFKGPKPGQDLRMDLPAIGAGTVASVSAAGLAGIALAAGGVLVIDRPAGLEAADAAGIFVWGREGDAS